jgi:hypothetical protein
MKIAILSHFGHLECCAFILEIYNNNNNNIDIYISKNTWDYGWMEYYSTLFNINIIYDNFNENILDNYDKIFKLTSSDNCLDDKKIISILHLQYSYCKSEKYITLTPYINGNNLYYTFPIYQPKLLNCLKSKIITLIGYYNDNDIDNDLLQFINLNNNYKFNFISWGGNSNKLKNIKNVNLLGRCCQEVVQTDIMIDLLNNSKYVLSKKYINYDRFSGQLGLAMSHEIPLIIDIKTKNNYKLPGIAFDKNYCEIENLDDITDEKYSFLKNEIKLVKNNILENNKMIFKSAF